MIITIPARLSLQVKICSKFDYISQGLYQKLQLKVKIFTRLTIIRFNKVIYHKVFASNVILCEVKVDISVQIPNDQNDQNFIKLCYLLTPRTISFNIFSIWNSIGLLNNTVLGTFWIFVTNFKHYSSLTYFLLVSFFLK